MLNYMKYAMQKIDAYRIQRNLTVGEMATIMGIGRSSYFRYLANPSIAKLGPIDKACSFLKIDASVIMDDASPITIEFV